KQLMADFKKAYEEKNLAKAQQLMQQLAKLSSDTKELQELKKQFAADVAEHVQCLMKEGVTYYSRQHYAQALGVWKEAQSLDPKNVQLLTHIDRASRILEKLQNLREKQGAE
ncbi:MAG: hypothetical protein WCQ99_04110, partial [Pseudomonadota bacterium]